MERKWHRISTGFIYLVVTLWFLLGIGVQLVKFEPPFVYVQILLALSAIAMLLAFGWSLYHFLTWRKTSYRPKFARGSVVAFLLFGLWRFLGKGGATHWLDFLFPIVFLLFLVFCLFYYPIKRED